MTEGCSCVGYSPMYSNRDMISILKTDYGFPYFPCHVYIIYCM